MAMGNGGGDRKLMSEINVTPMVDVMLVLLIIFMVTAPMLHEGIKVELPKTDTSQIVEQKEENVMLTVTQDGKVFLGDSKNPVQLKELPDLLKKTYEERLNKDIYLRGDQSASYGDVINVMNAIQKIGGLRLGLITEQLPKKK